MAAETCEFLILMVDKVTATPIRQPETEDIYLRFAALVENVTSYTATRLESHLSRPVKSKLGPGPRQQYYQAGSLGKKTASPPDWKSMVVISLVEDKALKKILWKCCQTISIYGVGI